MASGWVEAQHDPQTLQPLQIQGAGYPPLTPPNAPARHAVRHLELLSPLTVAEDPC